MINVSVKLDETYKFHPANLSDYYQELELIKVINNESKNLFHVHYEINQPNRIVSKNKDKIIFGYEKDLKITKAVFIKIYGQEKDLFFESEIILDSFKKIENFLFCYDITLNQQTKVSEIPLSESKNLIYDLNAGIKFSPIRKDNVSVLTINEEIVGYLVHSKKIFEFPNNLFLFDFDIQYKLYDILVNNIYFGTSRELNKLRDSLHTYNKISITEENILNNFINVFQNTLTFKK